MSPDAIEGPDLVRRPRGRPPGPGVDQDDRRETLLDATESAITASGGEFSLGQVAELAGLTRSAVYASFADKDNLIDTLTRRHTRQIIDNVGSAIAAAENDKTATRGAVNAMVSWVEDHAALAPVLMPQMHRGVGFSGVAGYLERLLADDFAKSGSDANAAGPWARALIGAVSATVGWWAYERTMDRDELVDHLTNLLWSGFSGARSDVSQLP